MYEYLVLGLLVLFWVGWCEEGYQLSRTIKTIPKMAWQRRVTLELWTGVLFSLMLSVLSSLSTVLPLLAMFLVFAGIESLMAEKSEQTLWGSILMGFRSSFRKVSQDPLHFLTLLAVPGLLLYLSNLILRACLIHFVLEIDNENLVGAIIFGILLAGSGVTGILLFFIARIDLSISYLKASNHETSSLPSSLDTLLRKIRQYSQYLIAGILAISLIYGLVELISSDLFGRNFFYSTLEASVGAINNFVQKIIDLLAKFTFILIVLAFITALSLLLVGVASGNGKGILERFLALIGAKFKGLIDFIQNQMDIPGQAIQITTIISAVGLMATQTYTKIIEAQGIRLEQQKQQEEQVKLQLDQNQKYGSHADELIERYQESLQSLALKDDDESQWRDPDRRSQVASMTRNLLRQLETPDGKPDGLRRARILIYLYDSRFLIGNESDIATDKNVCGDDALSKLMGVHTMHRENEPEKTSKNIVRSLNTLPQFALDRKLINVLTQEKTTASDCSLARLVPLQMNFSFANLAGVFLNNASMPFINLSHADLHGAQLRKADLRFANLENANLKGADLTDARLDFANLTNAELRRTTGLDTNKLNGTILFYSTHDRDNEKDSKLDTAALSWELTDDKPNTDKAATSNNNNRSIFCPLDPRAKNQDEQQIGRITQAGAKCNNRAYSGYLRTSGDEISNRNWASGDFASTTLENFRLKRIHFTNANLRDTVFRYVELNDVDFTGANLDGARFEHSVLNNVDFTGASVRKMSFVDSSVERSVFKGSEYVLPIQLGDYAENLLRLSGRNTDSRSTSNLNPPS
ncbi:MAG: pentapeptide repeat-containing protein, partial [Cyanobacteriota bacterium]